MIPGTRAFGGAMLTLREHGMVPLVAQSTSAVVVIGQSRCGSGTTALHVTPKASNSIGQGAALGVGVH